jgi:hypothetical protein
MNFEKTNINVIKYSGYFLVHEELAGDFELVIEANRCSLQMENCEKYANFRTDKICEKLELKKQILGSIARAITPPLHCPVKPGNYSLGNPVVDVSILNVLNFDGYIWVSTYKLVTTNSTTKLKKIILCYNTEVKMVKVRSKSKG